MSEKLWKNVLCVGLAGLVLVTVAFVEPVAAQADCGVEVELSPFDHVDREKRRD